MCGSTSNCCPASPGTGHRSRRTKFRCRQPAPQFAWKAPVLDDPYATEVPEFKKPQQAHLAIFSDQSVCLRDTTKLGQRAALRVSSWRRACDVAPQGNDRSPALLVDAAHLCNLDVVLVIIALVYAHSIDPDSPEALKRAGVLQHRPAVLCLEKDVPERTNKYGMAKGVVAIIAAPAVGGPFVLGALVVIVGLQLQMNE